MMDPSRQLCTFVLDDLYLGIPVLAVQEVIRHQPMTAVPLAPDAVVGLINLRGEIVTALDLRRRLGLAPFAAGERPMSVVVRAEGGAASLLVDRIGDVLDTDPADFEPAPETLPLHLRRYVDGVFKLPDRLLVVLDVERVLDPGPASAAA
ncbi:MAG: chemotaxis protein CheW [Myxococcota bacterium]